MRIYGKPECIAIEPLRHHWLEPNGEWADYTIRAAQKLADRNAIPRPALAQPETAAIKIKPEASRFERGTSGGRPSSSIQ